MVGCVGGWVDGWMEGRLNKWMDVSIDWGVAACTKYLSQI